MRSRVLKDLKVLIRMPEGGIEKTSILSKTPGEETHKRYDGQVFAEEGERADSLYVWS